MRLNLENLRLSDLSAVIAVVDTGGFSAAAVRLGETPKQVRSADRQG